MTNPTITLSTKTSNGTGTGSFTSTLTNLAPKTTYYVRAYANNSAGTGYGNEITFTTTDSSSVMGIPCPGTPTVKDIDGNTYNTVQIGTQCWTKENLRVTKYRDGSIIPLDESGGTNGDGTGQTWSSRTTGTRTVYGHNATNLATYGYLYNWYAAIDAKGLCPSGWHVPTDGDWTTLITYLGGESDNAGKMKSTGTTFWKIPNTGSTNESGFSALPGGIRGGIFASISEDGFWWSITQVNDGSSYFYGANYRSNYISNGGVPNYTGMSIRCVLGLTSNVEVSIPVIETSEIKDITSNNAKSGGTIISNGGSLIRNYGVVFDLNPNPTIASTNRTIDGAGTRTSSFSSTLSNLIPKTTYYVRAYANNSAGTGYGNEITFTTTDSSTVMGIPCPGTPTVKDIDGNTYNTVQIGTQCWTKENLRVTKYRDGSIIPLDESGGTEGNGIGETWSSRKSGARTVNGHNTVNLGIYGYLYNSYALEDLKGICPIGWHVPKDSEWTTLTEYLGGLGVAGGKMKSIGTTYWISPNESANNESGFSALPSGYRHSDGFFSTNGLNTIFWSAAETGNSNAWGRALHKDFSFVSRLLYNPSIGHSLRCIKDTNSIVSIPILTTTAITAITTTTATSGGNITADGGASITARGVVWSTSTNPTITLTTKTSNGTGTGSFTSTLTNLTPKTTYYVRAYATNSAGTGYGNEITFTTTDSSTVMGIPCPGTPAVKDIDGNTYNTIQIGTQCWTKENLRVTKYRDGSIIPLDESGGTTGNGTGQTWSSRTTGARTVSGHNISNLATYGYLYNWYAVADTKGLCPSGWHVPSDPEWSKLINFIDGTSIDTIIGWQSLIAGRKLKAKDSILWSATNLEISDETGFSGLPGGYRLKDGSFHNNENDVLIAFFWSSTENLINSWYRTIYSDNNNVNRYHLEKTFGGSVRCLKDTFSIVSIPSLSTTAISSITTTSATSGGNITSAGGSSITARGVVWSTNTNPNITLTTKTSNGTGTGSFTSTLTNLTPKTTYYVRAYATNSAGTTYGNEITFTTSDSSSLMGIPCLGTPTVKDIDGNTYNTVQIGTQCWTKENLRVTKYRDGSVIPLDVSGGTTGGGTGQTWSSRTTGARTVYGHSAANLATYGYLYNWYAVADSKGLCLSGWHVPSDTEWTTLTTYLGGENVAGGKMKSTGTTYWNSPNTGASNESGLTALPGGWRNSAGNFFNISYNAFFWSATHYATSLAWIRYLYYSTGNVLSVNGGVKSFGASVRCLKDTSSIVSIPTLSTTAIAAITTTSANSGGNITSDGGASITAGGVVWSTTANPTIALTTKTSNGTGTGSFTSTLTNLTPKTTYYVRAYAINSAGTGYGNEITFTTTDSSGVMGIPCPGTPTVQDIDGNTYNTVQIGTQCWTKENLRVTKYRDGTVIPLDESGGTTGNGTGQTWGNRNTGARTVYGHSAANLATYGYLYNWYTVNDIKGLCPNGWHVPNNSEWKTLITYLGGDGAAGGKMKSAGTTFWNSPNLGATNESFFGALPSGVRSQDSSSIGFWNIRNTALFWSVSEYGISGAWCLSLVNYSNYSTTGINLSTLGASIRCLKE